MSGFLNFNDLCIHLNKLRKEFKKKRIIMNPCSNTNKICVIKMFSRNSGMKHESPMNKNYYSRIYTLRVRSLNILCQMSNHFLMIENNKNYKNLKTELCTRIKYTSYGL